MTWGVGAPETARGELRKGEVLSVLGDGAYNDDIIEVVVVVVVVAVVVVAAVVEEAVVVVIVKVIVIVIVIVTIIVIAPLLTLTASSLLDESERSGISRMRFIHYSNQIPCSSNVVFVLSLVV